MLLALPPLLDLLVIETVGKVWSRVRQKFLLYLQAHESSDYLIGETCSIGLSLFVASHRKSLLNSFGSSFQIFDFFHSFSILLVFK